MRFQPTVCQQLLKGVSRGRFERLARQHRSGRAKRQLSEWSHFVSLVLAQFSGATSLRDLERTLESQRGSWAHLGLGPVRRSTLSDANQQRSPALFQAVAAELVGPLLGGRDALRLIDATQIFAGKRIETWSPGGKVKLHVVYDPGEQKPTCFAVSHGRLNDICAAREMPIEPGATYVFDKGYYDFGFWAKLAAARCRFVTRIKANSPLREIKARRATDNPDILADYTGKLSARLAASRKNPYDKRVRLVEVRISTGRTITLLTNDLKAPAAEIAALYKARWQIELFFKWIKQNLRIKRFLGICQNAVTLQILTALIAFLILRKAQREAVTNISLTAAASLAAKAAFQRRPIQELFNPPPTTNQNPNQLVFQL